MGIKNEPVLALGRKLNSYGRLSWLLCLLNMMSWDRRNYCIGMWRTKVGIDDA